MSLLKKMKESVKRSGTNKEKLVYFRADSKVRLRFMHDMDEGMCIPFHDSYALGINVPCQEVFGRPCEYCGDDDLRHRDLYAWAVYEYEANEVRIFMAAANSFTPIPALIGMYEEYGTLTDRDYVINRSGSSTSTTYSVVPMDKSKFRNKKVKALTHKQILKIIDKAYPANDEIDVNEDGDEEDKDWEQDYEDMTAKELYQLCKERDIDVEPRKKKQYYIDLLEEYDLDDLDEDEDEEEDDDW